MVKMLNPYHKLSQKDIENFEVKNNIELTNHYKVFLFKWNGGAPDPEIFMISEEAGPTVMNYSYSIGDIDNGNDLADCLDVYEFRLTIIFLKTRPALPVARSCLLII